MIFSFEILYLKVHNVEEKVYWI